MKEDINALDEINKGVTMGIDSIGYILDKIEDKSFKEALEEQLKKYKEINKKIIKIYSKYDKEGEPHKTNTIEKMMTYWGIEMQTMKEESDSKIAEVYMKGTNMGIIEGRRILNNKNLDKEVHEIAEEFTKMGEESIENLKKYL